MGYADGIIKGVGAALVVAFSLVSAGHALITKRDPRSALGWIVICLTLPVAGAFFYWCMGVNRIFRRARKWQESGRRLAGQELFPVSFEADAALSLVPGAEYMTELRRLADRVGIAPLVAGNRIAPLENGEEAYPLMLEAIAGARHSVHLSTYIFDTDQAGRRFISALRKAADRGVEVRVIVDGLGEKYSFPRARNFMDGTRIRAAASFPFARVST